MRILNICVNGVYTDGLTYHENLLPKYHRLLGNDVEILASEYEFDSMGRSSISVKKDYVDENGIIVKRLKIKHGKHCGYQLKRFVGLYDAINDFKPDVIFCHLFQFLDVCKVAQYVKKHPNVILYVDNHADSNNSARSFFSRYVLHKVIWRYCAQRLLRYAKCFYGVLPSRVQFLKDIYGIPDSKCKLLIMGADDELVESVTTVESKAAFRNKYGISKDDFLVVSGGKLDKKKNTIELLKAFCYFSDKHIKLILFGSIDKEIEKEFKSYLTSASIQYIGWADELEAYTVLASADVAVFPGLHSVYWEQTAGVGTPLLIRNIPGIAHLNVCGNIAILPSESSKDICKSIEELADNPKSFQLLKGNAEKAKKYFSYKEIAALSIS